MVKSVKVPLITIYSFLVILLIYFVARANYEFIGYAVVVGILCHVVYLLHKKYDFPLSAFWFFVVWVMLHMLGGAVHISGTRLYDLILINIFNGGGELVLLKYDQLIHAYCYFAISILTYFSLKGHIKKDQKVALVIFALLSAIGIGLLNEVIEFFMVLFAGAAEAVGGYYNTALDLVFNLIGAIVGPLYAISFLDK